MSRLDKKQRHRAKRDAKRRESKRRNSISPLKRLADAPGEIECWMSNSFDSTGQEQMFVYKRAAGLTGIACFLVDVGVVGLKDAWTHVKVDRQQFQEMIDKSVRNGIPMRRVTVDSVRRLVAGGIRWASQNGMRLPKDWAKVASVIGGVGDWASADVSRFKMQFCGHPEDLRQRLIGESYESYVDRKDIKFLFVDDAVYMDQETGEYTDPCDLYADEECNDDEDDEPFFGDMPEEEINEMLQRFDPPAELLAQQTADWLKTRNAIPCSEMKEAWRSFMLARSLSAGLPDASEDETADFSYDLLKELYNRFEEPYRTKLYRAVGQILEHLQTDSMLMRKAVLKVGLAGPRGDEPAMG